MCMFEQLIELIIFFIRLSISKGQYPGGGGYPAQGGHGAYPGQAGGFPQQPQGGYPPQAQAGGGYPGGYGGYQPTGMIINVVIIAQRCARKRYEKFTLKFRL